MTAPVVVSALGEGAAAEGVQSEITARCGAVRCGAVRCGATPFFGCLSNVLMALFLAGDGGWDINLDEM